MCGPLGVQVPLQPLELGPVRCLRRPKFRSALPPWPLNLGLLKCIITGKSAGSPAASQLGPEFPASPAACRTGGLKRPIPCRARSG